MNRLLITLLLLPLLAQAAPVDLSPPSNTLGSADRRGHLQFTVALQSADFGDGAKIPVHFTFNSGNQATSPYGWDNWTVGILEASVTDTKPGEKQVTLLWQQEALLPRATGRHVEKPRRKHKGQVDSCSPLRARQISPATPVGVRAGGGVYKSACALPIRQGCTCPLEVLGSFGLPIATQNVSGDTFYVALA